MVGQFLWYVPLLASQANFFSRNIWKKIACPEFKGGDYDMSKLAETRLVESYGGRAQPIAFIDGYSTSALVRKIRSAR